MLSGGLSSDLLSVVSSRESVLLGVSVILGDSSLNLETANQL